MGILHKYIFSKAYYFCINVFKEKEFPQYFATGIVTLIIITFIYILLSLIEYFILPLRFNVYGEYYKYFALVALGIALLYINYKNRYLKIIEYFGEIPDRTKKKLKIYSIIYLLTLFIGFFLIGALLRNYNINHPQ